MEGNALRSGGMRVLAVVYLVVPLAWLVLVRLNALWMYPAPIALALIIVPTLGWLYFPIRVAYLFFTATSEAGRRIIRSAWLTYGVGVIIFVWSLSLTVLTGVMIARNSYDAPSPEIYETAKWASPPLVYFTAGYVVLGPILTWLATRYVKRQVRLAEGQPESR